MNFHPVVSLSFHLPKTSKLYPISFYSNFPLYEISITKPRTKSPREYPSLLFVNFPEKCFVVPLYFFLFSFEDWMIYNTLFKYIYIYTPLVYSDNPSNFQTTSHRADKGDNRLVVYEESFFPM